jgi:hypothetical protein
VRGYDGGLPWHREEHAAVTGLQSTIVEASRRSGGGEGAVCDGNKHKKEKKYEGISKKKVKWHDTRVRLNFLVGCRPEAFFIMAHR